MDANICKSIEGVSKFSSKDINIAPSEVSKIGFR